MSVVTVGKVSFGQALPLNLINDTSAYVGFTSASGDSFENHDILSWGFSPGFSPGTNYCFALPNSTGNATTISAEGTASVSINEAVELAKKYGTGDSRAFVNGIVDRMARQLGRLDRRRR